MLKRLEQSHSCTKQSHRLNLDIRVAAVAAALIFTGLPACDSEPADDDDEVLQTTLLEVDLSDGEAWLSLREARVLEPNEVDDTNWDLHIDGWNLFLNGGASGNGSGAGIPFRDLDPDLQFDQVNREQDILYFLFQDDYGSVLSNWWAYGLRGGHTVYSRFHRYWLHDQGRWWKLQVLSYYQLVSGAPEAAQISFRWQESNPSGPGELRELVVDASAGGVSAAPDDPLNEFRYVDLERGEVTRLSDDAAATSMDWHIGFRRFYIRLNGGTSGPRGIASYDHDAAGEETPEALLAMSPENSLEGFEQLNWADRPDESLLSQDQVTPVLTGWYSGNPGAGASALPTPFLAATATDSHRAKLRVIDLEDGNQQSPLSLSLEYALLP